MKNLDEARAYQQQTQSRDNADLWSAILDVHHALTAAGGQGLPEATLSKAQANLVRAGVVSAGEFTDEELSRMATADGVREWRPDIGTLFANEPVIGPDRETYITLTQHQAQEGWAPGSEPDPVSPAEEGAGGRGGIPRLRLGGTRPLRSCPPGPRGRPALYPHPPGRRDPVRAALPPPGPLRICPVRRAGPGAWAGPLRRSRLGRPPGQLLLQRGGAFHL